MGEIGVGVSYGLLSLSLSPPRVPPAVNKSARVDPRRAPKPGVPLTARGSGFGLRHTAAAEHQSNIYSAISQRDCEASTLLSVRPHSCSFQDIEN